MAYTVVVSKESVVARNKGYDISLRYTVNDGAADVFEEVYTKWYKKGDDIDELKSDIHVMFLNNWDDYVDEVWMWGTTALDNAVADLQTDANTYVNQ